MHEQQTPTPTPTPTTQLRQQPIRWAIAIREGHVVLAFDRPLEGVGLTAREAEDMAHRLALTARKLREVEGATKPRGRRIKPSKAGKLSKAGKRPEQEA